MFETLEQPGPGPGGGVADPLAELDAAHAQAGAAFARMLRLIRELDRTGAWREQGARDAAHLIAMRYGVSSWKARRMVAAARALPHLPRLEGALSQGLLGQDAVLELARFATPSSEQGLIAWARRVSYGAIRRRGEQEERLGAEQEQRLLRERSCRWYLYDGGRRFHLEADLAACEGARLAAAIEGAARMVPVMPGEEHPRYAEARRADALVALCTQGGAGQGGAAGERAAPEGASLPRVRATLVLHAQVGAERPALLEGGGVAGPASAERLSCTGASEHVHETRTGRILSRVAKRPQPPSWMLRQLWYRDGGCTFPGCGTRAFCEAHHLVFYRLGGATTMQNLAIVCGFHHRLVHEHGWRVRRSPSGELTWYRPDGRRHTPGPVLRGGEVDPPPEVVVYGPFEQAVALPPVLRRLSAGAARAGPDP